LYVLDGSEAVRHADQR